jgi:RHS repeat-associated protein
MLKPSTIAVCAVLPILLLSFAQGQSGTDQSVSYGIVPLHTYLGGNENIDVGTGNVHIQIPLVRLPGRNGHDYVSYLRYNSQIWHPETIIDGIGNSHYVWMMNTAWKVTVEGQYSFSWNNGPRPDNSGVICSQSYRAEGSDGRVMQFPFIFVGCYNAQNFNQSLPQYNNFTSSATLGSYPSMNPCGDFSVLTADATGNLYLNLEHGNTFKSFTDLDPNGNMITLTGATSKLDTIGRSILQGTTNGNTQSVTYQDSNGATQTVTINWQQYTLHPVFGLTQPPDPGSPTVTLIQSVILANGDRYDFQYNNYGELAQITYPSGGYTKYLYATFSQYLREVTEKHVCRDTNTRASGSCSAEDITTFSPTPGANAGQGYGSDANSANTMISPVGDKTVFSFTGLPHGGGPFETQRVIYSGTITPLRTIATSPGCNGPTQQVTTLNDTNQQSMVQWNHDATTLYGYHTTTSGNTTAVTAKREYDFGSGAPGPLVRQTITNWVHVNPINSLDYRLSSIRILDRKASEIVQDGAGTPMAETDYEYDNYATPMQASGAIQLDAAHLSTASPLITARGNLTAVKRWLNTTGTFLTTSNTYDDAGNVLSTTDPAGRITAFSYADNFTDGVNHNAKAFVTQTTLPNTGASHVSKKQYYFNTSLPAASCGENFTGASCVNTLSLPQPDYATITYERLGRARIANAGDGGQTATCYSDDPDGPCYSTNAQLSQTVTQLITPSISKVSTQLLDGIGNVVQSQLASDPEGTDYVDTTYDPAGRNKTVSNPHRSGVLPTDGTTTYNYDGLNRTVSVSEPDGSIVTTSYAGNKVAVTDETGKQRTSQSDALGRLTAVWEDPGTAPHLNYETDYQYDILNNLIRVDQKGNAPTDSTQWRSRTFTYDSLSRLVCAANPELWITTCPASPSGPFPVGTTTYTYDAASNALTKASPAPNQPGATVETVTYAYDALNRFTQKSFSAITPLATPAIKYGYDGLAPTGCTPPALTDSYPKGRRTSICDASGATSWKHDTLGRVLSESRTIASRNKLTAYAYNLDGSLATLTYPTGRVITYSYSSAGRALSAKDVPGSVTYAQSALYTPAGALNSMQQARAGVTTTTTNSYNARQQPVLLSATAPSGTLISLSYDFHASTHADNGNVFQIVNNRNSNRTQNFTYDALNRIATAYTQGTNWGETFTIDAWGNLTNKGPVSGKTAFELLNTSATTQNRLTGFNYDAAGNMIQNGTPQYFYDAENHMTSASGGYSYIYDGDGNRVEKCTAGTTLGTCSASPTGTLYWMDTSGNNISESDLAGNLQAEYMYFGKRVGRRESTGDVRWYFSDHLGTADVIGYTTGAIKSESDYYPYGGEIPISGSDTNRYKFTGKERDSESGLDDFVARYYTSALGRFVIPDWSAGEDPIPYAQLGSPQTLNLYGYSMNNPVSKADPNGHFCWQDKSMCDSHGGESLADAFKATLQRSLSGVPLTADSALDSDEHSPFEYKAETSVTVLGQVDPVRYTGNLADAQQIAAGGIMKDAASLINKHAGELNESETRVIMQVTGIKITPGGTYQGIDVHAGTWTLSTSYMSKSSTEWLASLFAHEGMHRTLFQLGKYQGSFIDEMEASIMQRQVGRKVGLSGAAIRHLDQWITSPKDLQKHMNNGLID